MPLTGCEQQWSFKVETKALLSQSSITGVTQGEWAATKESHPTVWSLGADSQTQWLAERWLNQPLPSAACPSQQEHTTRDGGRRGHPCTMRALKQLSHNHSGKAERTRTPQQH